MSFPVRCKVAVVVISRVVRTVKDKRGVLACTALMGERMQYGVRFSATSRLRPSRPGKWSLGWPYVECPADVVRVSSRSMGELGCGRNELGAFPSLPLSERASTRAYV